MKIISWLVIVVSLAAVVTASTYTINVSEKYYNNSLSDVNMSANLSYFGGYNYSVCYQETANVSTSCGGLSTGSYNYGNDYLYVNYSKPSNSVPTSIWQVKHGYGCGTPYNISIPTLCWAQSSLQFRFYSSGSNSNTTPYCYNGSSWIIVGNSIQQGSSLSSGTNDLPPTRWLDGNWTTGDMYHFSSNWIYNEGLDCFAHVYEDAMYWNISVNVGNFSVFSNLTDAAGVASLVSNDSLSHNFSLQKAGFIGNSSVSVSPDSLVNVSLWRNNSLFVNFYDEQSDVLLDGTWVMLRIIGVSYAVNYSTTNGNLYVYGIPASDYSLQYFGTGYSTRLNTLTMVDSTHQDVNLYMLNISLSTASLLSVVDNLGQSLSGLSVQVLRYDINSNSYVVNQIVTTDSNGQSLIYVTLYSEIYYFIVLRGETVVYTSTPQYLLANTISIVVSSVSGGFQTVLDAAGLSGSLAYDAGVPSVSFSWVDGDGTATQGCLYIYNITRSVRTLFSSTCVATASGSIAPVALVNSSDAYYAITGVVTKGGVEYTLDSLTEDYRTGLTGETTNKIGLFIMLLIMLVMVVIFFEIPWLACITIGITIFLFSLSGFVLIPVVAGVAILLLSIVIAVLVGQGP